MLISKSIGSAKENYEQILCSCFNCKYIFIGVNYNVNYNAGRAIQNDVKCITCDNNLNTTSNSNSVNIIRHSGNMYITSQNTITASKTKLGKVCLYPMFSNKESFVTIKEDNNKFLLGFEEISDNKLLFKEVNNWKVLSFQTYYIGSYDYGRRVYNYNKIINPPLDIDKMPTLYMNQFGGFIYPLHFKESQLVNHGIEDLESKVSEDISSMLFNIDVEDASRLAEEYIKSLNNKLSLLSNAVIEVEKEISTIGTGLEGIVKNFSSSNLVIELEKHKTALIEVANKDKEYTKNLNAKNAEIAKLKTFNDQIVNFVKNKIGLEIKSTEDVSDGAGKNTPTLDI